MPPLKLTPQQVLRNTRLASCRAKVAEKEANLDKRLSEYYTKLLDKTTTTDQIELLHTERKNDANTFSKIQKQKAEILLRAQATINKFFEKK